jgi:hypothetical protein
MLKKPLITLQHHGIMLLQQQFKTVGLKPTFFHIMRIWMIQITWMMWIL